MRKHDKDGAASINKETKQRTRNHMYALWSATNTNETSNSNLKTHALYQCITEENIDKKYKVMNPFLLVKYLVSNTNCVNKKQPLPPSVPQSNINL